MAISKSRLGRGLGNLIAGGISSGAKPSAPANKPTPAKKAAAPAKPAPQAKAVAPKAKPAAKPVKPAPSKVASKPAPAKATPSKAAPSKPAQKPATPVAKPSASKAPAAKPVQGKPVPAKATPPAAKPAAQTNTAKPEARASAPVTSQAPSPKAVPSAKESSPAVATASHSAHTATPTVQPPVAATAAAVPPVVKPTVSATPVPAQQPTATATPATSHAVPASTAPSQTSSTPAQASATPAPTAAVPAHAPATSTAAHSGQGEGVKAPSISSPVAASPANAATANAQAASTSPYREIAVTAVVPNPYQPRREMDPEHIAELANSIASEGLLQPIVVRPLEGGKNYELIAGERRWRAHQKLGLKTIAARVMDASDSSSAVISLIENIQRQALNPIEEALGFASLMRDFDLTQEAVSERIGRARASIANSLRLLALDREIQGYVSKGILSVGHAKILLGLEEPAQRVLIARRIIEAGLSVRDTETLVRKLKNEKHSRSATGSANNSEADRTAIADLEKQLSSRLNTRVQLRHTPKKGRIVIEYYGNEDLQRILERTGLQL